MNSFPVTGWGVNIREAYIPAFLVSFRSTFISRRPAMLFGRFEVSEALGVARRQMLHYLWSSVVIAVNNIQQ